MLYISHGLKVHRISEGWKHREDDNRTKSIDLRLFDFALASTFKVISCKYLSNRDGIVSHGIITFSRISSVEGGTIGCDTMETNSAPSDIHSDRDDHE